MAFSNRLSRPVNLTYFFVAPFRSPDLAHTARLTAQYHLRHWPFLSLEVKPGKQTANYREEWAFVIQVAKVLRGQWDQQVHNFSIVWFLNIVYYVDFINLQPILWESVMSWLPVFVYRANTAEVQFSSTF
jgi:hypothetical protein